MPAITVAFNASLLDLDDFCEQYNYQTTIPNPDPQPAEGEVGRDTWTATIPNPETKENFFKKTVKGFVFESVKAKRVNRAAETARNTERGKSVSF